MNINFHREGIDSFMTNNSTDRLSCFEDVFTEMMIGFALAFLIAIGVAPQLVNLPVREWKIEIISENPKAACGTETKTFFPPILCPNDGQNIDKDMKVCPYHGTSLKEVKARIRKIINKSVENGKIKINGDLKNIKVTEVSKDFIVWLKSSIKKVYSATFTEDFSINHCFVGLKSLIFAEDFLRWILYIFIILFCVKILHEQSVTRYHLQDITLDDKASFPNFLIFVCRLVLLTSLYVMIIWVYVNEHGVFGHDKIINSVFVLLLFSAYVIPDWVLYRQLSDMLKANQYRANQKIKDMKETYVWKWMALNVANLLASIPAIIIIIGVEAKWISMIGTVLIIGVWVKLTLLPSSSSKSKNNNQYNQSNNANQNKFYRWTIEIVKVWVNDIKIQKRRTIISLPICTILFYIISSCWITFGKEESTYLIIPIFFLGINIFDWLFNWGFFFGGEKKKLEWWNQDDIIY